MNNETALLDATIQHLKNLKARGARFVSVDQEVLKRLARPVSNRPSSPARPSVTAVASPTPAIERPSHASPAALPPAPEVRKETPTRFDSGSNQPAAQPAVACETKPTLDPVVKSAAMADLRKRALACVKCPKLAAARKNVVFGVGDINAELMFVGEAPGADEDVQGEPFVGAAGQLLTRIIQTMGLSRERVYIGNILKCRPDTPGETSGNRKPTPEEMATCIHYLHEQIDLIQPRVLVALGGTAVEGLLGKTIGITKLRGTWKSYRGIPLMPTYHPAYLLRNQALAEKRRVWEDMLAVMEKLAMPVSEKQRNYFLSR